jgi:hypothetical protein
LILLRQWVAAIGRRGDIPREIKTKPIETSWCKDPQKINHLQVNQTHCAKSSMIKRNFAA